MAAFCHSARTFRGAPNTRSIETAPSATDLVVLQLDERAESRADALAQLFCLQKRRSWVTARTCGRAASALPDAAVRVGQVRRPTDGRAA